MTDYRARPRAALPLVVLAALLALPIAQTAAPAAAKQRSRPVTRTFRNTTAIDLPISMVSPVTASLYPSTITVGGLRGPIRDVNLLLDDFSHAFPDDVQVLLVGPRGQTAIVMANVGGGFTDVSDVTLRLDDEAETPLPAQGELQSGTFQPTNAVGAVIPFAVPAPSADASAALSVFDGSNPNGTWQLFVQDDLGPNDTGAFAGGWEIEIEANVKKKNKGKKR